jgi:hypothetical protein
MEPAVKQQTALSGAGLPTELVRAGLCGMHPLFDAGAIRRAFGRVEAADFNHELLLAAYRALQGLVSLRSLDEMRAHVDTLPAGTVDLMVFVYFRTLDTLVSAAPTLH